MVPVIWPDPDPAHDRDPPEPLPACEIFCSGKQGRPGTAVLLLPSRGIMAYRYDAPVYVELTEQCTSLQLFPEHCAREPEARKADK